MARGGKREGAGMKPGSKKIKLKAGYSKRTIRKLYQWTPDEYAKLQQAIEVSGVKESKIVQAGTMKEVETILTQKQDG